MVKGHANARGRTPLPPITFDIRQRIATRPNPAPPLTKAQVVTVVGAIYPAAGDMLSAEPVPQAFGHEVWRVHAEARQFALKVADGPRELGRSFNAVVAQRLAQAAGVPGPDVVAHDDGSALGRPLLMQE